MTYTVQWNYQSGLGGPWLAGQVLEVDDALAIALNHDSPGVLVPTAQSALIPPNAPPHNRQVTSAATRAPIEEVMTSENMPLAKSFGIKKKKGEG